MSKATKLLALASYTTLAFAAACQVRTEPKPQDKLAPIVVVAPVKQEPTSLATSQPAAIAALPQEEAKPAEPAQEVVKPAKKKRPAAPAASAITAPEAPETAAIVAPEAPEAAGVVAEPEAPAPSLSARPRVDREGRPAAGNVFTRSAPRN